MDIAKDTQDKIAKLQLFEQNLHSFSTQKRNIQSQMLEIENALKEIEAAQGAVYKIVGTVMFPSEKGKLAKDLKERKEVLDLRIKSFEKQEKEIEEKAKNVKLKIESAIAALSEESIEESLRANKALQELDDLSDDPNIPSYIRPQLWNILSQLETR